jgi:hypothetical protein
MEMFQYEHFSVLLPTKLIIFRGVGNNAVDLNAYKRSTLWVPGTNAKKTIAAYNKGK